MMDFTNIDLGQMLIGARGTFEAFGKFIPYVAAFVGGMLIFQGLLRAWKLSDNQGSVTGAQVFSSLIFGGLLLNWGSTTEMASSTVALSGGALGYMPEASNAYFKSLLDSIYVLMAAFGAVAILKGLLLWKSVADGERNGGEDAVWRGLWHILGGAFALNLGAL